MNKKKLTCIYTRTHTQASGNGAVEESMDLIYAGVGKFHVYAKFLLDGSPPVFTIEPITSGDVKMWPKTPEIDGDTMTCTFEATTN